MLASARTHRPDRESTCRRQDVQPVLPAAPQRVQERANRVVAELAREQRTLDVQQVAGPAVGRAAALAEQGRRADEPLPRHPVAGTRSQSDSS